MGWLRRFADRRRRDTEESADWGTFWESVAQMLDQDDEPLDEVGLARSKRHHPAGKGRRQ